MIIETNFYRGFRLTCNLEVMFCYSLMTYIMKYIFGIAFVTAKTCLYSRNIFIYGKKAGEFPK